MLFLFYSYTVCTVLYCLSPQMKNLEYQWWQKIKTLDITSGDSPSCCWLPDIELLKSHLAQCTGLICFSPLCKICNGELGIQRMLHCVKMGRLLLKISSEDEKCPSSEIIVEMSSEDYYQKMPYHQIPSLEDSKLCTDIFCGQDTLKHWNNFGLCRN